MSFGKNDIILSVALAYDTDEHARKVDLACYGLFFVSWTGYIFRVCIRTDAR